MSKEAILMTAATLVFTAAGSILLNEANSIDAQALRNQQTPQIDQSGVPELSVSVERQDLFNFVMENMIDVSSDPDFFELAKERFTEANSLYYSRRDILDPSMFIRYYPSGRVGGNPLFNFSMYRYDDLDEDNNPIGVFGVSLLLDSDGYLNPNPTKIGTHTERNLKRDMEKYFVIPEEFDDVEWELSPDDATLIRKRLKFADRTIAVGGYRGGALFFNVEYNLNEKATGNSQPQPAMA